MERYLLKDVVVMLHQVARKLTEGRSVGAVASIEQDIRTFADRLDEIAETHVHPERQPMSLQQEMEKCRTIRILDNTWWGEWQRRKREAAVLQHGPDVTAEQIDAAPETPSGFLDFHPLLPFDLVRQLLDADNLFWQAKKEYEGSLEYPDSEIATKKRAVAVQMMQDAKDRAKGALERWRKELESVDVPA